MESGDDAGRRVPATTTVDAFSLLQEPRRPWLDLDLLKRRFHDLSAPLHPDRVHSAPEAERQAANARYADLNAAFQALKEPRDRLPLLYELETGSRPKDIQRIPPGTMELFVEIGQACRDADAFLQRKSEATSPMLKLQLMQEGLNWLDRFQELQRRVNERREVLMAELLSLNPAWEQAPPPGDPARPAALPLERLEQVYRALSYVDRWTGQIQERSVQLAM
jgi:curved DNA-binding protein CbpA